MLSFYNKDESPIIILYREEIQKLRAELEEYKKENYELKREMATLKVEKSDDSHFLLY